MHGQNRCGKRWILCANGKSHLALPDGLIGEIINGQLRRAQPRTAWPHISAGSRQGADIEAPYGQGRGGPGGWWIIDEPEVHFVLDAEISVPDIAGWPKECRPSPPAGHQFQIVPDWICEKFSPATKSIDRPEKMPLFGRYAVQYDWLVDPKTHTPGTYELIDAQWRAMGIFRDNDIVSSMPFDAIVIQLADLWG